MDSQTQQIKASTGKELPPCLAQVPRPLFGRQQCQTEAESEAVKPVSEKTFDTVQQMERKMPAWLAQVPRPLCAQQRSPDTVAEALPAKPAVPPGVFTQPVVKPSCNDDAVDLPPTAPPSNFATLPPVVSVKKSSKRGCAYALLRDPAIIERCVLQRVAVVDGVCVEMTRHSKKSRLVWNEKSKSYEEDSEAPAGIFVAWGVKVERKVPVSEEGLEEFFNSLAGKPCPEGLLARPPFPEGHVSYPLTSKAFLSLSWGIAPIEANQADILAGGYCNEDVIKSMWEAKGRLDALWDRPPPPMARSLLTRVARSQLFPCSGTHGKGDQEHENRAGDKLAEIVEIADLLDGIPAGSAFLDLCGGPGAWSQHLLAKQDLALRGFGFTLKADVGSAEDWKAEAKDEWYDDLYEHPKWKALWGADGTGDLLKLGNLEHCVRQLANEHVLLCVADGGFSDDSIPQNLLELYFYRLFLAELLTAVSCLGQGGKFVCKLYTSFSTSTAALLFLTTRLFESVEIVKPVSSKATGPERYLVASGFLDNSESSAIQAGLMRAHTTGGGASPLVTPLLTPLVPAELLASDENFRATMTKMVSELGERQALALNAVVDRAIFLEDMAMECAVCTDPFSKMTERKERLDQEESAPDAGLLQIPTPSRNRSHQSKGKGKGKGKGKSNARGSR